MVNSIELFPQSQTGYSVNANKTPKTETVPIEAQNSGLNVDTLELSNQSASDKVYTKADTKQADMTMIKELQEAAEFTTRNLMSLVEKLILKQTKHTNLASLYGKNLSQTEAVTVSQASESISETGDFGVEAVSDRIVDFAIKVSGGDTSKLEVLKGAIQKGFEAAGKEWGGDLPSISMQTYDRIMEKLDKWAGTEKTESSNLV
ncbi:MAG: hypothetical protein PHQ50_02830 [Eubacteriales bacterium]|nr:hypothetical protein [Eubacteriales bacterium]MDD3349256.1 hypothetical protein [Eubacteriales bacterium]